MTSGLSRPRRRLDAIRRPQILATATELVREKGLWSVRISDVAKRAGMSPANVVYYFGTKDELFAAAITQADDMFYGPVLQELAPLPTACCGYGRDRRLGSATQDQAHGFGTGGL